MFVRSLGYCVDINFEISKVSILSDINTIKYHQVVFGGRHSALFLDEHLRQLVLKGFKYFVFFRTRDSPKNISWST